MALPEPVKTYENALKEVDELCDRLCMPIDEKIKPLVAALRMYGITTTQSCQGHSRRGIRWPWIQVAMESVPAASKLVCAANARGNQWVFEPRPVHMRLRPSDTTQTLERMQKQAKWLAKRIRDLA